ncbi:conserved hypothetical protein [Psychromonas ingrahamii 37]|uniref:DNA 3'-5' helicase II n=1 Tax=Psychromonas ingrahamii (strain DSM 17664 / CCUG 51855 / 37) TaxID=357804 RepID=A1SY37_PSYIN|nr:3'-5' exonuclease [Psychromonas ingrahamii]ABM04402.1 conserved hypothetical protein [Psychromonas ingrahamii 37]
MSWMVPAHRLDAEQSHFLLNELGKPGNKWIKGVAGSGKSVLLLQSLNDILHKEPNAKILMTYYTHSLKQMYLAGIEELNIDQTNIHYGTYFAFRKMKNKAFDYIFCDEVQDFPEDALTEMTNHCKQLFICGDVNQSLYDNVIDPTCISSVTKSKGYTLTTIHRLTQSIVKLITKLMPSLGDIRASKVAKKADDVTVRLGKAQDEAEELKYIIENAAEEIKPDKSAAVLLPSHNEVRRFIDLYCDHFNINKWSLANNQYGKPNYGLMNNYFTNFPLHYIGNSYGNLVEASKKGKLTLMTYHSAKGLDFDTVYLPFLNKNTDIKNETLFMVALSRSKNTLVLTHTGSMHMYLNTISDSESCHKIDLGNSNYSNVSETLDDDFDF